MIPLFSHVEGAGEPVLLLNGIMMTMAGWDPVARDLAADYRVVRCDLRGQFLSPGLPPAAIAGHAEDVIELLDHARLDAVHVVGTSFGALVGITMAAIAPHRVRSLVAMTATDRTDESLRPLFESLREACARAAAGGDKAEVFDLIVPYTFSTAWQARHGDAIRERREAVGRLPEAWFTSLAALLESAMGVDLGPLLPRVACRTLVVGAEDDRMFAVGHSRRLAASIGGARLHVVGGGSHGLVVERPGDATALVRQFLRGNGD